MISSRILRIRRRMWLGHAWFLERYLDRPIEEVLAAQMRAQRPDAIASWQPIVRAEIVEVGNLA